MNAARFLKTRVPDATKTLVRAAADREFLTESTWFRRVIEDALKRSDANPDPNPRPFVDHRGHEARGEGARLYVRLQADDRMVLRERAAARGMPAATYASVLLRSHLRQLPPLPKEELLALKYAVAELGAIGRNLNQIARAANQGGRSPAPTREDLRALLKVCEALREHVKGTIKANLKSWAVGHAEDPR